MKMKTFLLALATSILISATPKTSVEKKYSIDINKSKIQWTGYYVFNFGNHYGTISLTNGELFMAENEDIKGFFEIDMHSIQTLDMKADNGGTDLTNHLKSDDFFSVDQYSTARFEILDGKKIKDAPLGKANYEITGNLTIKGITNPIKFPATISMEDGTLKASAKFKFDRTKWNIRYNSGRFFDDVGDGAISDGIGMEIEIIALNR